MTADVEARYRAYLAVLNDRRLDDLEHYVQDELTYNGAPMTRRQYRDLIAADVAAVPDLRYDAHLVVASGDQWRAGSSSTARRSASSSASPPTAVASRSPSTCSTASRTTASPPSGR